MNYQLWHEAAIVWLVDPNPFRYVRVTYTHGSSRTRKPRWSQGTYVGYGVLGPVAAGCNG